MSELKPCPFCGGEAKVYWLDYEEAWFAGCGNNGCHVWPHICHNTEAEAIEAWNRRYEPPKLEPIFACASAPVLKDERVEVAYRKGRFDERLQQQIFASAV